MAVSKVNTNNIIWVAIDVAKHKHDVLIEYPNGSQKSVVIQQTQEDFERLLSYLNQPNTEVVAGFEATGYYHRLLAYYLINKQFTVKLVSSIATARTRESQYNSLDKNDKRDTKVILYLLKSGITQIYHDPLVHQQVDTQELSNSYRVASLRKTKLQHSIINHYLSLYFPEAEKYFCSTRAGWFADFFHEFPCPSAITRYSLEEFLDKSFNLAGRKVDKKNWLKDVYRTAKNSIGLPVSHDSTAMEMYKKTLKDFSQLCDARKKIEAQIESHFANHTDYNRLKTVPGIGPIIALTILAEAGDLRRFRHVNQFLKFCGFDLTTQQSGDSRGKSHLSKRGNAELRKSFWMAATIATRMRENTFRKKYENYLQETSKNADVKRKAYVAVAAKMARVVYSMITHNTDYYCTYGSSNNPAEKLVV